MQRLHLLAPCLLLLALPTQADDVFLERSRELGLDFVHQNGMTGEFYMVEINCGGGALFDYDNDGDLDVYLVQGGPLGDNTAGPGAAGPGAAGSPGPGDRLLRNDLERRDDGSTVLRFTDVTAESGIQASGYGFGVAAGDYDNDGDVDLYVTNLGGNQLWRNNGADAEGRVTFSDVTAASGTDDRHWSVPALFFDYDGDGWLDLYVGNYLDFSFKNHKVCRTATGARDYCGPSAFQGVPDRLLRNRGGGADDIVTFEDVSRAPPIGTERSKSLGAVVADFNADGKSDLYVANDGTANQMWIQTADGKWSDEALLNGAAVNADGWPEASMGVDAGDFDNDGDADLFMTHLVSETNTLFVNDGTGVFEDATKNRGLALPSLKATSWGTAFFDYDNDGWLDLFVAGGAVRVIEALARAGDPYPFHEKNQLFHNRGGRRFEDVSAGAGSAFELSEVSRAAVFGDLDNDGDTDVLVVNNNGPARLLMNQVGNRRHWLGLRLAGPVGTDAERDMLGTEVTVHLPGGPALWRRARTDGSFASANDPRVLVGLGEVDRVERIRVIWPDGQREEWQDIAVDRYTTLRQGGGRQVQGSPPVVP